PMTKWFNTNYHYLVPHITCETRFRLRWNKPLFWAKWRSGEMANGAHSLPYVIGPYTFIRLSRGYAPEDLPALLQAVAEPYQELLSSLREAGAPYVHLDEPAFVLDVPAEHLSAIQQVYQSLGQHANLLVMTYYDSVDFLPLLYELPIAGIGLDFVHGKRNLQHIGQFGFPSDKILVAGVIDGRNVWRSDFAAITALIRNLQSRTGATLWLSNGSPLMHLPVTVAPEEKLEPAL
ncbi:MAG: 5-methyltetrahydropteroyltriglutamate--homocysteine S-methyltransferase, partial [Bacteroidota bacterium]|nr:5-methyltetrahydropteroyltriglutamate--homocysteine S-methyltransferase [Candidatus Kapabacteria bacterium]MDW8076010.1 5-methyltetrahydropteroyltriglutamate--homocysteine S-methyltransferase [Bacteroidota bacterium]